jgi:hypothetical protein
MKRVLLQIWTVCKKAYKWLRDFFTKQFVQFVILLVVTIILGVVGVKNDSKQIELQQDVTQQENFPFFQYEYSDGIFRVTSDPRTAITKVEWYFPARGLNDNKQWELVRIGGHPIYLGFYEIRDYLAREIRANTLLEEGKNAVICNLYLFADNGIPALISVTYDKNDKQNLSSMDFVLITRIDTPIPEMIAQPNGRNVSIETGIKLLNEQLPLFGQALEIMDEQKSKACGLKYNQPFEGFTDPGTSVAQPKTP